MIEKMIIPSAPRQKNNRNMKLENYNAWALIQMPTKHHIDQFMSEFPKDVRKHMTYKFLNHKDVIGSVAVVLFDNQIYEWLVSSEFCQRMSQLGDDNPYLRYTNPDWVTFDQNYYRTHNSVF
mgnify:CR=1 FL=1